MKSPNCFYLHDEVLIKPYTDWFGKIVGFPDGSSVAVRVRWDNSIRAFPFAQIGRP